jgi:hypothetical protein
MVTTKTTPNRSSQKRVLTTTGKTPSVAKTYNAFKEYNGAAYTGMAIGRAHKWNYDKGVWRETKVTPDQWELTFDVIKRRAGHAPEGSGAPVGTAYHWFILAHQYVEKLDADDYRTSMVGLKFKLAHKRASRPTWSASGEKQRKSLIKFLKVFIHDLEQEPESAIPVPLHFQYRGKQFDGVGIPMMASCNNGICNRLDITLNKKHLGVIKCTKNGWRLTDTPQGLANAIGEQVFQWYE